MKTIWKYELKRKGVQIIAMPRNAEILTVQAQGNNIALWAVVDTEEQKENRHFEIVGTGGYIDETIQRVYLGTIQFSGLVYHIFERTF